MKGATDRIYDPKIRCGIIRRRAKTLYLLLPQKPSVPPVRNRGHKSWPVPAAFGPRSGRDVPVQPARTALCLRFSALFPAQGSE